MGILRDEEKDPHCCSYNSLPMEDYPIHCNILLNDIDQIIIYNNEDATDQNGLPLIIPLKTYPYPMSHHND